MQNLADNNMKVVNFNTRDFQGSIDIDRISKVISLPKLTLAPTGPDYVIGLLNLAGTVIPVIDLSMRLSVSNPLHYSIDTPILVCKTSQGQEFGILVESVDDIAKVTKEMIQTDVAESKKNQIVDAAIKFKDSISLLINVNYLLDEDATQELKLNK